MYAEYETRIVTETDTRRIRTRQTDGHKQADLAVLAGMADAAADLSCQPPAPPASSTRVPYGGLSRVQFDGCPHEKICHFFRLTPACYRKFLGFVTGNAWIDAMALFKPARAIRPNPARSGWVERSTADLAAILGCSDAYSAKGRVASPTKSRKPKNTRMVSSTFSWSTTGPRPCRGTTSGAS